MNKQYKILMLDTQEASRIYFNDDDNKLTYGADTRSMFFEHHNKYLYVLSDKYSIEKGDYIHTSNISIERVKDIDKNYSDQKGYEWLITVEGNGNQYKPVEIHGKIEVSTNPIITLHTNKRIPESFIKAYIKAFNEGHPIKEIALEVVTGGINRKVIAPITREDNSVIIHQAKTYTREEVTKLIQRAWNKAFEYGSNEYTCQSSKNLADCNTVHKWIEDNL